MSQTKITVKIFEPLLKNFDKQIETLFIKRDAFLNRVLQEELKHLARDMQGKKMSSKANRYISGELKKLGTKQVNIVVDQSTADELKDIVNDTNIVRDAFFNRLILLLRSNTDLLKYLDLPAFINGSEFKSVIDPMPTSPLQAMLEVLNDPLYYLREGAEERLKTGLYLIELPPKLVGFTCYLDDAQVPGTEAYKQSQIDAETMLEQLLMNFEAYAFQKPEIAVGRKS
ncbi:MAG: hypothetical protein ACYC0M_03280 [Burkholderiales bacterium]